MPETERELKLRVLCKASFDWVRNLDDVWSIPEWDVPGLHGGALKDFLVELSQLKAQRELSSPPGLVIAGPGGTGKTHLLGRFCREAISRGGFFVLCDMSAIRDVLETVLKGMVKSLITPLGYHGGRPQAALLAEAVLAFAGFQVPQGFPDRYTRRNPARLHRDMDRLVAKLAEAHPREATEYLDVLRTILLLGSRDPFLRKAAFSWLKGLPVSLEEAAATGYTVGRGEAELAISGLSFFMALNGGFTVFALDQMDHVLSLFSLIAHNGHGDLSPSVSTARAIITNLSDGLGRLTSLTSRTLAVLSCLPLTWDSLLGHSSANTSLQRYRRPPVFLSPLSSRDSMEALVAARLREASRKAGWDPPYPTWPFRPDSFEGIDGINPRALMERCHRIVRGLLLSGEPAEVERILEAPGDGPWGQPPPRALSPGEDAPQPAGGESPGSLGDGPSDGPAQTGQDPEAMRLETEFRWYRDASDPEDTKIDGHSDDFWPEALSSVLGALASHGGGNGTDLRLTPPKGLPKGMVELVSGPSRGNGENAPAPPEERRLLLRANLFQSPKTFQHRLETMMDHATKNQGGPFRMVTLRFGPNPTGLKSQELVRRFDAMGGLWRRPGDRDIQALAAFLRLRDRHPDDSFDKWLAAYRPWEGLGFLKGDLDWLAGADGDPDGA
ncbi:MAG: hypothetical protein LBF40_00135 [Deltaproteobacteria bacterium]|jgi:hypothetical protein|nr:hypothetical protein [Deltaproteobacteria bacterium]